MALVSRYLAALAAGGGAGRLGAARTGSVARGRH